MYSLRHTFASLGRVSGEEAFNVARAMVIEGKKRDVRRSLDDAQMEPGKQSASS
jgi:hypothetical protein